MRSTVLSVRPKVAELVCQLFGRSVHPELFDFYQTRSYQRGQYVATVSITSTGHLVTWKVGDLLLTEVATSAHVRLPEKRRLMSHRIRGQRDDYLECHGGIRYNTSFSLEPVSAEKLRSYQTELSLQSTRNGLLHHFETSGRFDIGAISYMHVDCRDKSFRVRAFHTFPDDSAVVRIESAFQLP